MVKQAYYALSMFAWSAISVNAFLQPPAHALISRKNLAPTYLQAKPTMLKTDSQSSFDPLRLGDDYKLKSNSSTSKLATFTAFAIMMLSPEVTNAAGPDWGIFEGRTGSLLHPAMMASMFVFSVTTGLLGFQIRRTREIGDEIKELKRAIPDFEGGNLEDAIAKAESQETVDFRLVELLKAAVPTQKTINELTAERKTIIANNPRDKHFSQGALLAFLGTAFAIEVRIHYFPHFY